MTTEAQPSASSRLAAEITLSMYKALGEPTKQWLHLVELMSYIRDDDSDEFEAQRQAAMETNLCLDDVTIQGAHPGDEASRYAQRYQASLRELKHLAGASAR